MAPKRAAASTKQKQEAKEEVVVEEAPAKAPAKTPTKASLKKPAAAVADAPQDAKAKRRASVGKFAKAVNKKAAAKNEPTEEPPKASAKGKAKKAATKKEPAEETSKASAKAKAKAKAKGKKASVGKFAKAVKQKAARGTKRSAVDEEADAGANTLKRPAAAKKGKESDKEAEEKAVADRTKELKAMAVADVKDLVKSKGLATGTKGDMIEALLGVEAKAREQARARAAKVREVLSKIKADIAAKSAPELKDMCAAKGLKLGGSKDEKVDRLVEKAKADGEVDKILANIAKEDRRTELAVMDKNDLSKMCLKAGIDPLVKEVMVERLLQAELPN